MHIPPYYKKESWQKFLVGAFLGAIIAYAIFIYMYGQFYERWVEENLALRSELNDLESNYNTLKEEFNAKSKEKVTVNAIEVSIMNQKQLKLDSLIVHQLEELIKEQIKDVLGKDIESLSENYTLLTSTIENKIYKVDGFSYSASVNQLFLTSTLRLNVQLKISN
ncbi:sporulation membrane protein YtrI [Aquibacillus albus]|uniref:Nuclease with TOPRIM domain n=1 Tax=Aquibacillus albus TaxID=1168171 RepID=A0ABS2N426_9BACI|nr:sporulation membrane protein YtrI [Aquibacillus albus]MBM7572878.1 putative nuclease with TOPRIM domain [Aquibacillus albus]